MKHVSGAIIGKVKNNSFDWFSSFRFHKDNNQINAILSDLILLLLDTFVKGKFCRDFIIAVVMDNE